MTEQSRARPFCRRQTGLAMVEFAISAPVLLLLMFGTFEFGHFLIQYSVLNDAVRNASRYVAGKALGSTAGTLVTGAEWTSLVTKGTNLVIFGNIAGTGNPVLPSLNDPLIATIAVTPDTLNRNIAVSAAYTYQPLFGTAIPTFMGGSISTAFTLNISITMRAL
jgi:Flp pilus assembly protein TadG